MQSGKDKNRWTNDKLFADTAPQRGVTQLFTSSS
jgi:hypothetical protein